MRTATALVFVSLVALAACSVVPVHKVQKQLADKELLQTQKDVLRLLQKIHQNNLYKDQVEIGETYDIEANIQSYKYPKVVKQFLSWYKKGLLPRGEPFSVYYPKQKDQAILLFELFYYANDYDTFYKTACWARDKVNEGLFMYSFSIAVFHRQDTQDVVLPPPYEVYPYLFVPNDVIQLAQKYRMIEGGFSQMQKHVIPVNYTTWNDEQLLTYFTEDVSLNTFYLYYRYYYPTWYNTSLYGHSIDKRGEMFYYMNQQIYGRYYLERLSNDLPDVQPLVYNEPLQTPYNPNLKYQNGEALPIRPNNIMLPGKSNLWYLTDIQNYEQRVASAIQMGYVYDEYMTPHSLFDNYGMEYIGQMIEGTYNSPNFYYYGSLYHYYRLMVGQIVDPLQKMGLAPSVMEHPETVLRDPAYYQLWKRIYHFVQLYKTQLPRYTYEELNFEGIKVENVEVGKLYTYLEPYEYSVDNAVYVGKVEEIPSVDIRARDYRLNHKPFTYNVEVTSEKDVDVYVRIYLGPKYDYLGEEYDLNELRHYFVELDRFPYHVKVGKNVIERNSQDSSIIASNQESYRSLYKKVQDAYEGKMQYYVDKNQKYCGYPENLLIPKGKKGGMPFTFYVIVTPYIKQDEHDFEPYGYKAFSYCGVGSDRKYPDDKPLGFPFDRTIYSNDFYTPNMYFKDVIIFHKKYDEVTRVTH